jgi:hypothetical protein
MPPSVSRANAHLCKQVVDMWETEETGAKEMKCQWFYRPNECQHESLGLDPGLARRVYLNSPMFQGLLRSYTSAAREFMRLHPQEVFLTIHDDPNPISTIVSGALCFKALPTFSFCAVL